MKIVKNANLTGFLNQLAVSFNLTDTQPLTKIVEISCNSVKKGQNGQKSFSQIFHNVINIGNINELCRKIHFMLRSNLNKKKTAKFYILRPTIKAPMSVDLASEPYLFFHNLWIDKVQTMRQEGAKVFHG